MVQPSDNIPASMRRDLDESRADQSVIPAALVVQWMSEGYTAQEIMILLLPTAQGFARSPVSHFHVGAIAMGLPAAGESAGIGNLYLGASYEFLHEALNLVVHAEQSAVNNALLHGEPGLLSLAISAPPCGYCRQFMFEISTADTGFMIVIQNDSLGNPAGYVERLLTDLLPDPFGPADLGKKNDLMLARNHGLRISAPDALVAAAVAAMNASYAPYSRNYSGVGLQRSDGSVFVGRYAENAAYNPSLLPMESALSQMNLLTPMQSELDIAAACLVEVAAPISQFAATTDVLRLVAPGVTLQHIVVST